MQIQIALAMMLAGLCALLVQGCATWSTGTVENAAPHAIGASRPTSPEQVVVMKGDIMERPYASLGDITVTVHKTTGSHPNPTRDHVNRQLQKKAAALGADAVIFVRYGQVGLSALSAGSLEGKGRAIKFQP